MKNLLKYQVALDKISEVAPLLTCEAQNELKRKSEEFMAEVQESQYIKVPLVGVFSAGKSSLLNMFTGKVGMLPVDTMPETAVAYELYYAATECVELYRDGKKIDTKSLSDIKMLETQPGDIVKVYCTSEPVKALQEKGIILVDMPGIGSGIERHDAAIFNYIKEGTAFLLLVDAEQGSLRGESLAFMNELSQYGLFPAVLVSKTDKKPENDVKDIVEYIRYQMTKLGNDNPFIGTICAVNNDLDDFNKYLESLNAEALITENLSKKLKLIINSLVEQIKIRIEMRTKDIDNVEEKIKQLDKEINNVKVEQFSSDDADTPEKSTQDILDNVKAALEAKATDIAQMIIDRENAESIKSVIVSTIRTEIITSLKEESEQYSNALGNVVQKSVQDLAKIEINTEFLNDISFINDILTTAIGRFLLGAGGIWAKLATIILPILPKVLNWLLGKSDAEVLEEVKAKVISICTEQVIEGIRPTILKITKDNQKRIQEKIQEELVAKMEEIKAGLREKIADANKSKEEVETELGKLNAAVSHLNSISIEMSM